MPTDVIVSVVLTVSVENAEDARDEALRIVRAALSGPDEIVIDEITVEEVLNDPAKS